MQIFNLESNRNIIHDISKFEFDFNNFYIRVQLTFKSFSNWSK
jgi:hypothetical protein